MKIKYLLVPLFILAGCTKGNSAEDYYVELSDIVIEAQAPQTKIEIAKQFLDFSAKSHRKELKEFIGIDPVRIDWCAAFVNAVLHEMGIPGSESVSKYPLVAKSFLGWGKRVKEPKQGDVVVFHRGTQPWQGHVGFYYGTVYEKGRKYYQILGGNQDKSVTIQLFLARSAISIRRFPKETQV
jgi:uncharacterized protein (TIGR02594 family)